MQPILFITTNKHKFEEVHAVMEPYGIKLEQLMQSYSEDKDADMAVVVERAARDLAPIIKRPFFVEDTGLFFKAYNNFPGALPKFIFNGIGFDGIFRLLAGKDRSAYFKTYIAYNEPDKESQLFFGEMHGQITEKIILPDVDAMPYDHIFIPEGQTRVIAAMSLAEKNNLSQRGQAAHALANYLINLAPNS
jgi:XTP/dITP diphosphohydrolase